MKHEVYNEAKKLAITFGEWLVMFAVVSVFAFCIAWLVIG